MTRFGTSAHFGTFGPTDSTPTDSVAALETSIRTGSLPSISMPAPAAADYTHQRPLDVRVKEARRAREAKLALQREADLDEQTEELRQLQDKAVPVRGRLVTAPPPDSLPALWNDYVERNVDWTRHEIYAESARSSYYRPNNRRNVQSPAPTAGADESTASGLDGSFDFEEVPQERPRSTSPFKERQKAYARKRAVLAKNSGAARSQSAQGFQ